MKNRLIIISDLWGIAKSDWLFYYTRIIETEFDITIYDSCELGEIDTSDYTQESLHKQFVERGIETAVKKLLELEQSSVDVLAFSIGGTIAWKFGLRSQKINRLICVSSTRLRHEIQKPKGEIELFYGENDEFKPSPEWIEKMNLKYQIIPQKGHLFYSEAEFAPLLCKKIKKYNIG